MDNLYETYEDNLIEINKLDDNENLEKIEKSYKYNKLASFFYLSNNYEKCFDLYSKAMNIWPKGFIYTNLYMNLGNYYSEIKDYNNSTKYYNLVIKYFPKKDSNSIKNNILNDNLKQLILLERFNNIEAYIESYNNLGFSLLQNNKPEEALKILKFYLNTYGFNKNIFINLTNSLRYVGKYKEAINLTWDYLIKEHNIEIDHKPYDIDSMNDIILNKNNINIISVKWGKKYSSEYVNKLYNGFKKYLNVNFEFYCFTDDSEGLNKNIHIEEIHCDLKGWWTKAYIFSKELEINKHDSCNLFIDLDVIIVNDLNKIIKSNLKNFNILSTEGIKCEGSSIDGYNSSIVIWNSKIDFSFIYDKLKIIFEYLKNYVFRFDYWLEMLIQNPGIFQSIIPYSIQDYLESCQENIPKDCFVVIFPREPKPHDYKSDWIKNYWI